MTKTRATFTIGTVLLLIAIVLRLNGDLVSDTGLLVFALWNIAGVVAALSEDLTGKRLG